jgi:hypothetical protein
MFDLLDVDSEGGTRVIKSVPIEEMEMISGLKKTRAEYSVQVQPWLVPAGHRLRIEIAYNFIGNSEQLFYYGKPAQLGGLTIGLLQRV